MDEATLVKGLASLAPAINDTVKFAVEMGRALCIHPAQQIGDTVAEGIRIWREANLKAFVEMAGLKMARRGIEPKAISDGTTIKLLKEVVDCDSAELRELFAGLLASHFDPKTAGMVHSSFIGLISQMSPVDSRMVNHLYQNCRWRHLHGPNHGMLCHFDYRDLSISIETAELSVSNLKRLGILFEEVSEGSQKLSDTNPEAALYRFTKFGFAFATACIGPLPPIGS